MRKRYYSLKMNDSEIYVEQVSDEISESTALIVGRAKLREVRKVLPGAVWNMSLESVENRYYDYIDVETGKRAGVQT